MGTLKTNKSILLIAGVLVALLTLAACGGDDDADFGKDDGSSAAISQAGATTFADDRGIQNESAAERPGALLDTFDGEGPTDGFDLAAGSRKIIFTSSIDLDVENVTSSFQAVSHIATGGGGFVESSDLTRRTGSDGEVYEFASVTIRVPSSQYGDVLEQLRSLSGGTVTHEDSRSTEVTEEYADLTSRIRNLERTENRYLALLEQAETIQDILVVTDRLDGVRLQIEQLQGRVNLLDELVDLATIHVTLDPALEPAALVQETKTSGPIDALAAAWEVSLDAASGVLVILAYAAVALLWLGPLAIVALVAVKWHGRSSVDAT